MKVVNVIATLAIFLSQGACAAAKGVQFNVKVTGTGKAPSVLEMHGHFGEVLTEDISSGVALAAVALHPGVGGLATTTIRVFKRDTGERTLINEATMRADLSKTPSFQYVIPGTSLRVEVMPRTDPSSSPSQ